MAEKPGLFTRLSEMNVWTRTAVIGTGVAALLVGIPFASADPSDPILEGVDGGQITDCFIEGPDGGRIELNKPGCEEEDEEEGKKGEPTSDEDPSTNEDDTNEDDEEKPDPDPEPAPDPEPEPVNEKVGAFLENKGYQEPDDITWDPSSEDDIPKVILARFFKDDQYGGDVLTIYGHRLCKHDDSHDYRFELPDDWKNEVTSVQSWGRCHVTLFDDPDRGGDKTTVKDDGDAPNIGQTHSFNDTADSVELS